MSARRNFLLRTIPSLLVVLVPTIYLCVHAGLHKSLRELESQLGPVWITLFLSLAVLGSFVFGLFAFSKPEDFLAVASRINTKDVETVRAIEDLSVTRSSTGQALLTALKEQYITVVSITDDFLESTRNMTSKEFTEVFERRAVRV